jgi:hypothetical protein
MLTANGLIFSARQPRLLAKAGCSALHGAGPGYLTGGLSQVTEQEKAGFYRDNLAMSECYEYLVSRTETLGVDPLPDPSPCERLLRQYGGNCTYGVPNVHA